MMRLYHWTNIRWLEGILAVGMITTTDSSLAGPTRYEVPKREARRFASRWTLATEPKVVWLSNNPVVDATYLGMVDASGPVVRGVPAHLLPPEWRKDRVRITVEVPDADALWWPRWSRQQGIREAWYRHLAEGHRSPKEWFVVARAIPLSEFIAIHIDGDQVWPKTGLSLDALRKKFGRVLAGLLH